MNTVVVFSILLLLGFCSQIKGGISNILSTGGILFFILLISTRGLSVPDTDAYIEIFNNINSSFTVFSIYTEIGFQYLAKLSKLIFGADYIAFFALICVINSVLLYCALLNYTRFLKSENNTFRWHNYVLLFVLYFAFFGLYYNAIVLRAGIAILLIINASIYAAKPIKCKADYIKILLFLLFAIAFHTSAIIGVAICLISHYAGGDNKFSQVKNYILIGGAAIAYLSGAGRYFAKNIAGSILTKISSIDTEVVSTGRFQSYIDDNMAGTSGFSFKFLFFMLSALLFNKYRRNDLFYDKSLLLLIIGLWIYALLGSVTIIERISDFFMSYSFILYYIYFNYSKNRESYSSSRLLLLITVVSLQLIFVMRIINR